MSHKLTDEQKQVLDFVFFGWGGRENIEDQYHATWDWLVENGYLVTVFQVSDKARDEYPNVWRSREE